MFANVILPLPLTGVLTYAVPDELSATLRRGMRVLVPLGKTKHYIGVVDALTDKAPEGCAVKPIIGAAERKPSVTDTQLRLWHWIAEYYMAPVGEACNAALPQGLKSGEGVKPKTETCLALPDGMRDEQAQHMALNALGRSRGQYNAMCAALELLATGERSVEAVPRDELVVASHQPLTAINALVKKGFLKRVERPVSRLNRGGDYHPELIKPLSAAQLKAKDDIIDQWAGRDTVLLHGVTSSGKTEIYIHLIRREIEERHRQVLYLLPEIALTVQLMERLRRVFGDRLGIYHSGYSDAERVEVWQRQLSDKPYDVILGARSAVLLPMRSLGLVIVDEEHEQSFKQQDPAPRYHARSVAAYLARLTGAKMLLGSATPSLETWRNAKGGPDGSAVKYGYVRLGERYSGVEPPEIRVVDTADLRHRKMMSGVFSPELLRETRAALDRHEQAILFLNRRGYAPTVSCRQCGWSPRCTDCDVSLTLHRTTNAMVCHYCGRVYAIPPRCPACESADLTSRGWGTEQVETAVCELFPDARVARMDYDTTRSRTAYADIIADFAAHRTDILIGTQMVSKGLDFADVSVVGILNADAMLGQPDFRAHENAWAMISQVSGRAGRRGRRGLVILQTSQPDLPIIRQTAEGLWQQVYSDIADERLACRYPPYTRLVSIYLKHRDAATADHAAADFATALRRLFGSRLLGPTSPVVARVKGMNIRKMMLKLELTIDLPRVRTCLHQERARLLADKRYAAATVYFDVDPV